MGISTEAFGYIAAAIIFLTSLAGSIGPIFVVAPHWTARLESLAGGVFLAGGLAHLLPDGFEELENVPNLHYPLAPAVCAAVFVIFTLISIFSYSEHDAGVFEESHHHPLIQQTELSDSLQTTPESRPKRNSPLPNTIDFGSNASGMNAATMSLFLIICVHSAIEGIALGLLSEWSQIIAIFSAIVAHKPVEAFALSLIILRTQPPRWLFMLFVTFYVLLTPIGEVIGIVVGKTASHLALGLIESFSAGAFIFVGCHEWTELFEHKHSWPLREKLWHFGLFAFGVTWMLLVAIIEMFSGEDE
jgi:zinc transporter 1/2/3